MDHGRLYAKGRQDNKGKVVIGGHDDPVAGRAGMFIAHPVQLAICIDRATHSRVKSDASLFCRTNCDVEIIIVASGCRSAIGYIPKEKAYYNAAGFIFDRREAGSVHFIVPVLAIAVRIADGAAVSGFEVACCSVTNTETGGILDDDPCKHQAGEFDHTHEKQEQERQDKRKFNHGLRFLSAGWWASENFCLLILHGFTLGRKMKIQRL